MATKLNKDGVEGGKMLTHAELLALKAKKRQAKPKPKPKTVKVDEGE